VLILVLYIIYPFFGFLFAIEPANLIESLKRTEILDSVILSLTTATISTLLVSIFGIPLAFVLARFQLKAKFLIRVIVILPLVLPPLASGTMLLGVFGPYSFLGKMIPIDFTQSVLGIVIAQTYVASPFLILPTQAAFESIPERYEIVARTLGKKKWQVFFSVSLPLAKIGILIGLLMAWVRSIGELGATIMMAYNPHTISIQIFEDNAIGGIRNSVAGIILVIIIALVALTIFVLIRRQRVLKFGW
jgi:molybdate/tungstate transport system permease protein